MAKHASRSELMDELGLALKAADLGAIQIVQPEEWPLVLKRPPCLQTCGTQYRGCDPKCVRRLMDEFALR